MDAVILDAMSGLRALRTHPGFAIVAIAALAVGIGINAAAFAVVDAALFRGFAHVEHNDRLVQIGTNRGIIYYPDFQEWRSRATSFADVALVRGVFHTFTDGGAAAKTCFTTEVTTNTFRLLGVAPILGRDFSASDEQPGSELVVMLRYEFWTREFGSNPAVIGHTVRIDGRPARIVGVMPQGFSFPTSQELWTPLVPTAAALRRETGYAQYAYARLADGATVQRARSETNAIAHDLANLYPRTNQGLAPVVKSFQEWFIGANAKTLYEIVWGAAAFVLLVISANVANLTVGQAIGRSHEIAIRLALGASHGRITRQFLAEALVLSMPAGVLAWWLAWGAIRLYGAAQIGGPIVLNVAMDRHVLAYIVAITAATASLANVGVAAHLIRVNLGGALADRSRGIAGAKHGKSLSDVFVGIQVVLAVVLLAGAGVFIRSLLNLSAADVGVDTSHVLTMSLYAPPERYANAKSRVAFYNDVAARLAALPGVASVAFGTAAPTEYTPRVVYTLEGEATLERGPRPAVAQFVVSTAYFQTLDVRMIAGRDFDNSDRTSSAPVAIVNEQFAVRHWPHEAAVGKHLRFEVPGRGPTPWLTVVGVVSNIIQNDRTRQAFEPVVYLPYEQQPQPNMFAFVRTAGPPTDLVAAVRRQLYLIDPNLPLPVLGSVADRFDRTYAFERHSTIVVSCFAVITMSIAALGLYAAVSRSVSARETEIGVRRALGATTGDIVRLVFTRATCVVAIGWSIGLVLSAAIVHVIRTQFVGVSAADPVAFVSISTILLFSAALGCGIPAARATRVDPAVALRRE